MQGLRSRKQGPGGSGRHERILSTEGDESDDDDDSSPTDTAPVQKLNDLSLGPKTNNNRSGAAPTTDKDSESDTRANGETAFDVTKLKGKGKRGVGGRPMKAPDSKAKEQAAKDTKKAESKKKVLLRP